MQKKWWVVIGAIIVILVVFFFFNENYFSGVLLSEEDLRIDAYGGGRECGPGFLTCEHDGKRTCCNRDTHICCPGGICCPAPSEDDGGPPRGGDAAQEPEGVSLFSRIRSFLTGNVARAGGGSPRSGSSQYCGHVDDFIFGDFYFCKVTPRQCQDQGLKICWGKDRAKDKSICCPTEATCGSGEKGVPICVYSQCGVGEFECPKKKGVGEQTQCCDRGTEKCVKINTRFGAGATWGCTRKEGTCEPDEEECHGEGNWHNMCCYNPETQACTHDVGGFARCQGNPD